MEQRDLIARKITLLLDAELTSRATSVDGNLAFEFIIDLRVPPGLEAIQPANYLPPVEDDRYHCEYEPVSLGRLKKSVLRAKTSKFSSVFPSLTAAYLFDRLNDAERSSIIDSVRDTLKVFSEDVAETSLGPNNDALLILIVTNRRI